jgi:tricorn protease
MTDFFAKSGAGFWSPPMPLETGRRKARSQKLELTVDPRAEWKQIYREAWRIMRDWFYDQNHHGLNLAELEAHYAEYLPTITRRADLNALMIECSAILSVSHLGIAGGDLRLNPPVRRCASVCWELITRSRKSLSIQAHLSGDKVQQRFELGRRRSMPRRSVCVRASICWRWTAREVDASRVSMAISTANESSGKITVGPNPTHEGARTLTVFPIANEANLRLANWAEENRRRVEEASGGKLGYIYVNDYGAGTMDLIRGLAGYGDRPGVIIDQRYNGGGITPDYLIEWLRRRAIYSYTFREGDDIPVPVNPAPSAKVLIVNQENFSAAETFAFMYKLGKVGPIVGMRTGGGGIGPYVYTPRFIDGGNIQLPNRAAYNPDGTSWESRMWALFRTTRLRSCRRT